MHCVMYNLKQFMFVYMCHCFYTFCRHTAIFYIFITPGRITSFFLHSHFAYNSSNLAFLV